MTTDHLDALGFLVQSPTPANPQGFPVGFTQETDRDGIAWTGLGCAACHTGEVRYHGTRIRIDGGQGDLDFNAFEGELLASLQATLADRARFTRWADALQVAPDQQPALARKIVGADDASRRASRDEPGRSSVRPRATGCVRTNLQRRRRAVPRHRSEPPRAGCAGEFPGAVGRAASGSGAVERFGAERRTRPAAAKRDDRARRLRTTRHPRQKVDSYESSVDFEHLGEIENDLYKLRSPRWPEKIFGALDQTKVASGAAVYAHECERCHALSRSQQARRRTQGRADAAQRRRHRSAHGAQFPRFGIGERRLRRPQAGFRHRRKIRPAREDDRSRRACGDRCVAASSDRGDPRCDRQLSQGDPRRARSESGLLQGAAAERHLVVGAVSAQRFGADAGRVAQTARGSRRTSSMSAAASSIRRTSASLSTTRTNATLFDTTLPGNSNAGHTYGTALSDADKLDLLEYLKSL